MRAMGCDGMRCDVTDVMSKSSCVDIRYDEVKIEL
jgi:hypothetical protein